MKERIFSILLDFVYLRCEKNYEIVKLYQCHNCSASGGFYMLGTWLKELENRIKEKLFQSSLDCNDVLHISC